MAEDQGAGAGECFLPSVVRGEVGLDKADIGMELAKILLLAKCLSMPISGPMPRALRRGIRFWPARPAAPVVTIGRLSGI